MGVPTILVQGNDSLAKTDLQVEDDPANANCQPWRYQFLCAPQGQRHQRSNASLSPAGKCQSFYTLYLGRFRKVVIFKKTFPI
jgi:hypothetical protein